MPEALRIFISHKMPTDTPLAQEIGSKLALYGGNQVKVTHAGKFRHGEKWRERIQRELNDAQWLIFLSTDQDEDWGFCLFECGYFRHTMESNENKRLLTFCRKDDEISESLKEFNAVVITEDAVVTLLEDIYTKDPWKISPELELDDLKKNAKEIVSTFMGSERVEQNFEVATSITIELVLTEGTKADLKRNRIPDGVTITGTKDWQQLFGRDIDTGGWVWRDLIKDWPHGEVYEFLIAKMISDALNARMPKGILLRTADPDRLYRMTLRRYERMAGEKYRFHFTAALLDLPFDLTPELGQKAKETVLYHLMNLSWYFRRRLVDQLYNRILEVLTMDKPDTATMNDLCDTLGSELMEVSAQAFIRGLDNALVLQRALDPADRETQMLMERLKTTRDLRENIFRGLQEGPKDLRSIASNLYSMAMLNYDFYQKTATSYAKVAQELSRPLEPPGGRP